MTVINRDKAATIISNYKKEQKRIVFTNGCFDIIHRGHIEYLREAKQLGDILVVGLNSDISIKKLKGEFRPFQNEQDRAAVLDALIMVDIVVIFVEETPLKLICELKPDVLVKGGDYDQSTIVGAQEIVQWGGRTEIIPFLEGYGTSQLVKKILEQ